MFSRDDIVRHKVTGDFWIVRYVDSKDNILCLPVDGPRVYSTFPLQALERAPK